MSEGIRRPYAQVLHVAQTLVRALEPACERIEIAGSLRRQAPMVSDIEIVAIPKVYRNLLGEPLPHTEVDDTLARWPLVWHRNGPKYKAFSFEWQPGWNFKIDLFLQPGPATWGVNFLLRTGSADFSHRMVTSQAVGGLMPAEYQVYQARVRCQGETLDTPEEEDVFRLWKMNYVEPEAR